jgi:hypothetical protein
VQSRWDPRAQDHEVLLTNLHASTTYQYKVRSRDAVSNAVYSEPAFVTTLAATDIIPPTVWTPARMTSQLPYLFFTEVLDNMSIDRVEFYLNGVHIGTDYDAPYFWLLSPTFLGFDYPTYFGRMHNFQVLAFDLAGNNVGTGYMLAEVSTCRQVHLTFETSGSAYVQTEHDSVPDHEIVLHIDAKEMGQGIDEQNSPFAPTNVAGGGGYEWQPVKEVRIYFDDRHDATLIPDEDQVEFTHTLYTGPMDAPSEHIIRVETLSHDECLKSETATMSVGRMLPRLFIHRLIVRDGTYLTVIIEIQNLGPLTVDLGHFTERIRGFQALPTDREDCGRDRDL